VYDRGWGNELIVQFASPYFVFNGRGVAELNSTRTDFGKLSAI
jgi:hypothetical protein